jgi:NADPH:quinone reductase-like Zn-dependent oxidoreductase
VEARHLAPLAADIDHTVAAALPISGLTAWQGLFDHGHLTVGQSVLIHGAAGGVGSIAVQLAREAGARVIGTGRAESHSASGRKAQAHRRRRATAFRHGLGVRPPPPRPRQDDH